MNFGFSYNSQRFFFFFFVDFVTKIPPPTSRYRVYVMSAYCKLFTFSSRPFSRSPVILVRVFILPKNPFTGLKKERNTTRDSYVRKKIFCYWVRPHFRFSSKQEPGNFHFTIPLICFFSLDFLFILTKLPSTPVKSDDSAKRAIES